MKTIATVFFPFILFFSIPSFVTAQKSQPDPVAAYLFSPELIMQNQQSINLGTQQREQIKKLVTEAQSIFTTAQWDLQAAMEALHQLLNSPKVNESKVMSQLDEVLRLEKEIKRAQLQLMIRIKNQLTKEQQEKLQVLK